MDRPGAPAGFCFAVWPVAANKEQGEMKIVFWEKPGCMGNARQKAILAQSGHEIDARSLPGSSWSREELLAWLGDLPVPQWFNRGARRVQEGEIDPDSVDLEDALSILSADPILIRRPLVEVAGVRMVGFDLSRIEALAGPLPDTDRIRRVRQEDLAECPGKRTGVKCGDERQEEVG
jgi:nitrogenase-associated protein